MREEHANVRCNNALTLRREDRRNVGGYASELEYFAAETHLVVVPERFQNTRPLMGYRMVYPK